MADSSKKKTTGLHEATSARRRWPRFGSVLPWTLPIAAYGLALLFFLTDEFSKHGFPLDDAWIHRVYSRSFAAGHGFQYNSGNQEAGLTSPLWAIVTTPAHWLEPLGEHAMAVTVKTLGVLLGLISILAVQRIIARWSGSMWVATAAATLFALEPRLHFSALSGMETILLVALWTGLIAALLEKRVTIAAVLAGLAPVTRPEALLVLPFFLGSLALAKDARPVGSRAWIRVALPLALPSVVWSVFCKSVTGHWLPTTFYMKSTGFHLGSQELGLAWGALTGAGFASLLVFGIGIVAFVTWCLVRPNTATWTTRLLLVLGPLVYLVAVVGSRHFMLDGYYWTRWTDPASLLLTACFGGGYGILLRVAINPEAAIPGRFVASKGMGLRSVAAVCLLALVLTLPALRTTFLDQRGHLATDSRAIHIVNVEAGEWIRKNTPENAVVGVNDAGAIRYFGDRRTIDLVGLNHADIAFGHKTLFQALGETNWLVIFPSWFARRGATERIDAEFEMRKVIQIPVEEYTVCNCPGQTINAILERRRG